MNFHYRGRAVRVCASIALLCLSLILISRYLFSPPAVQGLSTGVVISQVYGGGGNGGATLTNDFIELFNRGGAPVDVTGWSVQYASSTGTSWQVTSLSGVIAPGQYYLIQQAQGTGGTVSLPTPDATGTIAMSATTGKVALVSGNTSLSGSCPLGGSVIDFVGYGSANCFETTSTPALSNTTAAIRGANGCTETDNNSADFIVAAPTPRNSASPASSCGLPTNPSGIGAANPNPVIAGNSTLLTVAVTPGTNPTSTGITVVGDLTSIGGAAFQSFFDNGTNGDVTAGDNVFSFLANVSGATTPGSKNIPASIGDAQSRAGATSISLNVQAPSLPQEVVISQVYGGGGNSGATYTNDFIELFNRGSNPVDLGGWSVQYASSTGTSWSATPLSGILQPGQYYLVQQAAGSGGTTPLPTPDATGTIAMSGTNGKVALVSSTASLSGSGCPFSGGVVDFVGYGTANCFEGSASGPGLSNTTAAFRARGGCRDTNQNAVDFSTGSPNPRNTASPLRNCAIPPQLLAINAIQGSGTVSPYVGQEVTTNGIVTARKSNGFFIQTIDGQDDSNPATSEGIFVFTSSVPSAAVGDSVSVVGTVGEFFGLTQVGSSNPDVTIVSSANALPGPIALTTTILNPAGPVAQLERFEGMRLSASSLTTISPSNEFGEVYTVLTGVVRPLREPGIEISLSLPPGSPGNIPRFDQNPERIMIDTDGQVGALPLVLTSGVTLSNITGPLDYSFGNYKIAPDSPPTASANLVATSVPLPQANEFTIASFNLENFYSTNSNFADRLNKASLAIRNVMQSPDIIGVEEVGDIGTLTALANKINDDAGAANPNYQAYLIEGDIDAQDDIDVGFLVKASRVNVVSITQEGATTTYINPLNGQPELLNDRPPLILRATIPSPTGSLFPVTVIANHLRSLIGIDEDPGDGPRVREKRRQQAEFLANLTQSLQGENLVLIGDFNAYQFNDGYVDVIGTVKGNPTPADQVVLASSDLVTPNLTNLIESLDANQRYSFNFEGNGQSLDHVLVDGEMLARTTFIAYARNNSDFPDDFAADGTRSERVSDHDMPVAYFSFPPPAANLAITVADAPDPVLTNGTLTYTITVTNNGPDNATGVAVSDTLPSGVTFAACSSTGGGICGGNGNNRTVTFATINSGSSETVTLTAVVNSNLATGTILSNVATVNSTVTDPDSSNNSATATTTVNLSVKISPVVECVIDLGGGAFKARFGYNNPNPVAITIPVGNTNKFTPSPQNRGQATFFLPGRQRNVFDVTHTGGNLVWTLNGKTATASLKHPTRCSQ